MNFYLVVIVAVIGVSNAAPNSIPFLVNYASINLPNTTSSDCSAPINDANGKTATCANKVESDAQADMNAKAPGLVGDTAKLKSFLTDTACCMGVGVIQCVDQGVKVN